MQLAPGLAPEVELDVQGPATRPGEESVLRSSDITLLSRRSAHKLGPPAPSPFSLAPQNSFRDNMGRTGSQWPSSSEAVLQFAPEIAMRAPEDPHAGVAIDEAAARMLRIALATGGQPTVHNELRTRAIAGDERR